MRSNDFHPGASSTMPRKCPPSTVPIGIMRGSSRSPKTSNKTFGRLERSSTALCDAAPESALEACLSQPSAAITITHSATRAITGVVAGLNVKARGTGPTLETLVRGVESPRLVNPELVEGTAFAAHPLSGPPIVGFSAFLNGIQQSRVLFHSGLVPIVRGTAAAVIRIRRDRRLTTHSGGPRIERAVFAPRSLISPALWDELAEHGAIDTGPADAHPMAMAERAVRAVERRREALERALAEAWTDAAPLWIDGPLSIASPYAVGIVRTHRTLYGSPEAIGVGWRSSVFRVGDHLSWYLRLRDPKDRDPLWGLLRIEVAEADTEQVDLVSRWVMAEASPLALPDPRWDTLVYGVRDCEEYLRAVC
jgi:hypothetical protein